MLKEHHKTIRRKITFIFLFFCSVKRNSQWGLLPAFLLHKGGRLGVTSHALTKDKRLNIDSGRDTFISLSPRVKAEP